MQLPDFPDVTEEIVHAISSQHGLYTTSVSQLPTIGIFNAIYLLGNDVILRIPRNHPTFIAAITKEALAVPAARAAGIRTPELLVFDDTRVLLPVPFTLYERVWGKSLELFALDPKATPHVYHTVGEELARLHQGVVSHGPIADIGRPALPHEDPRSLPGQLASEGYFTAVEARWLERWLDRLMSAPTSSKVFLHGDTQATNILVDDPSLEYRALIDWGSCGWGEAALDFAGMPLRAVPDVLTGYREVIETSDDTIEQRILLIHLHIALDGLRRGPQPTLAWGERPLSYLLDIMHMLLESPDARWGSVA